MKKFFAFFLLPLMAACTVETLDNSFSAGNGPVSFTIGMEGSGKAALNGLKPEWVAGDQVSVFANGNNQCYQTGESGSVASFGFVPTTPEEQPQSAAAYYFCYPYSAASEIDFTTVYTNIPARQVAVKDGICPEALVMAGASDGISLNLYNCVALVKITLTEAVSNIVLTSNSGEKISGKVGITLSSGVAPAISCTGNDQVLLTPPAGSETIAAGTYYAAVAPKTISGGLDVLVIKNDKVFIANSTNSVSFVRSEVMSIGDLSTIAQEKDTKKLTIDFFKTGKSKSYFLDEKGDTIKFANSFSGGKEGTFAHSEFNLYTGEDGDGFQFSGYTTKGLGLTSGQGFRFLRSSYDYLRLPAINGMKLTAVRILSKETASHEKWAALAVADTTDIQFMPGAGSYNQETSFANSYLAWYNPKATAGNPYDFRLTDAADGQVGIGKLEIFYTGTPQPSVKAVKTGACKIDGSTATLKGSYTKFGEGEVAGVICGFEYRAIGASAWTNVSSTETTADFTKELADLTADGYEVRAYVTDNAKTLYGNVVKMQSANEITVDFKSAYSSWASVFDDTILPIPTTKTENPGIIYPLVMLSDDHLACEAMVVKNADKTKTSLFHDNTGLVFSYCRRTSYLSLPIMNGLTITKVVVHLGQSSTSGKMCLQKMGGTAVTSDLTWTSDAANTLSPNTTLAAGEKIKVVLKNEKNIWTIQKVVVTYSGKALPTVMYVCPPAVSSSSLSAKVYVNSVTTLANVTAGFEKKAGESWSDLASASCTGADGILAATATASVSAGDIIRAWSSVDGGTTKVYSNDFTVQ